MDSQCVQYYTCTYAYKVGDMPFQEIITITMIVSVRIKGKSRTTKGASPFAHVPVPRMFVRSSLSWQPRFSASRPGRHVSRRPASLLGLAPWAGMGHGVMWSARPRARSIWTLVDLHGVQERPVCHSDFGPSGILFRATNIPRKAA